MNMYIDFIEFRHGNISYQEKELIIRVDSFQLSLADAPWPQGGSSGRRAGSVISEICG